MVPDLRRCGDGHIVNPIRRQLRMAPQQFPDAVDDQIVGPGLGVYGAGFAERGAYAVDKDHILKVTRHTEILLISNYRG